MNFLQQSVQGALTEHPRLEAVPTDRSSLPVLDVGSQRPNPWLVDMSSSGEPL